MNTGEHNFPCIHDFTVGDFTEWSDRVPLHFSLLSKTDLQPDNDSNGVKYQWDSKNTLEYKSLLITKLPDLNQVIHNIDCNGRDSINNALIQVTEKIRSIADPLCCKPCNNNNNACFTDSLDIKDAECFDNECLLAKTHYIDALEVFNRCKSDESRHWFITCKAEYKSLVKRKKRLFMLKEISEIEKLRTSRPKQFWRYFKSRKSKPSGISMDELYQYFKKTEQ